MRLLLLSVAVILAAILAAPVGTSASQPHHAGYDILSISDSTPGGHGDVSQQFTAVAGDHPIATATIQLPLNWDIAKIQSGQSEPIVGTGELRIDVGPPFRPTCDGVQEIFPLTIYDLGKLQGDPAEVETNWVAVGYTFAQFTMVVKDSAPGQSVEITLLTGIGPQTCTPMDLTLTFQGISTDNPDTGTNEGGQVVMTQPSIAGVNTWTVTMKKSPPEDPDPDHPVITRCDQIGIGATVSDGDSDGIGDGCDNCPSTSNADQRDSEHDGIGDVCDPDDDNDGILDGSDLCPSTAAGATVDANGCSQVQMDQDLDGYCDPGKSSTLCTGTDNCPANSNPGQEDWNNNGIGDACDDSDGDAIMDDVDNCRAVFNQFQIDGDLDGVGNACDNCPSAANSGQEDFNGNGVGDACEDSDGDTVMDDIDNCPAWPNTGQALPPWPVPPDDPDCDGWSSSDENVISTDPFDGCPDNTADDAWPADINNDGISDISDIALIAGSFGLAVPPAPVRHDVAPSLPDAVVDISDIAKVAGFFGQPC